MLCASPHGLPPGRLCRKNSPRPQTPGQKREKRRPLPPAAREKPLRLAAKWNRRRVYGRPRGPSRYSAQKKGKGYLCLNRAKPHLRRRHRRTPGLNGKKTLKKQGPGLNRSNLCGQHKKAPM